MSDVVRVVQQLVHLRIIILFSQLVHRALNSLLLASSDVLFVTCFLNSLIKRPAQLFKRAPRLLGLIYAQSTSRSPHATKLSCHLQESAAGQALLAAVSATDELPTDEQVTVFAPTNAAFESALEALGGDITPAALADVRHLQPFLVLHVPMHPPSGPPNDQP